MCPTDLPLLNDARAERKIIVTGQSLEMRVSWFSVWRDFCILFGIIIIISVNYVMIFFQ